MLQRIRERERELADPRKTSEKGMTHTLTQPGCHALNVTDVLLFRKQLYGIVNEKVDTEQNT